MTLPTPEPINTTADTAAARKWLLDVYQPIDDPTGTAATTARQEAVAGLRERIRTDGYDIVVDSVAPDPDVAPRPIVVLDTQGNWRDPAPGEMPTGNIMRWTANARGRVDAASEPVVTPEATDHATVASFRLPDVVTYNGGGVRLVHTLGGPVTCATFKDSGQPIGYLFSSPLDDTTEIIELPVGVRLVTVTLDPPEPVDTPSVATGDVVEAGDQVGTAGHSTGAHVRVTTDGPSVVDPGPVQM